MTTVPKLFLLDNAEDCLDDVLELGREFVVIVLRWVELEVIDTGRWKLIDASTLRFFRLLRWDFFCLVVDCSMCCKGISSDNPVSYLIVETAGSMDAADIRGDCLWDGFSYLGLQSSSNPLSCLCNDVQCWDLEAPACSHPLWAMSRIWWWAELISGKFRREWSMIDQKNLEIEESTPRTVKGRISTAKCASSANNLEKISRRVGGWQDFILTLN